MSLLHESLEPRRMLSVTLQEDGVLAITGTTAMDFITVDGVTTGMLVVTNNRLIVANDQGTWQVEFREEFDPASVTKIEIHGGDGRDVIRLDSDIESEIWGDDKDDAIIAWGSSGHVIHGGQGSDFISTGDGDDTLYGDGQPDHIQAHGGNDLLSGGGGGDHLHGFGGRDRLYGGPGSDLLVGREHADRIFGHDGDDTIIAGQGNDTIEGGAGLDDLRGGSGDDLFLAGDLEVDTLQGGGGTNTGEFDDQLDVVDGVEPDDMLPV